MKAVKYGKHQAEKIVPDLLDGGRWFQVTPWPCDVFEIAVKDEVPLPVPFGAMGLTFDQWIAEVDRHFGEDGLSKEVKAEFADYFLQGLTPSEAIYQDRADQGA